MFIRFYQKNSYTRTSHLDKEEQSQISSTAIPFTSQILFAIRIEELGISRESKRMCLHVFLILRDTSGTPTELMHLMS